MGDCFPGRSLLLAAALLLAALAVSDRTAAQSRSCGEERKAQTGLLDEATYKRMSSLYELVGKERYQEAYDGFVALRKRAGDDYFKAVVAQAIAQVEWARGNYDAALREFELAVQLDALPDEAHYALMYQIAQLYFMQERMDEALQRLDLWFCKVPPEKHEASAWVLKASILAQKQDWPAVIPAISKAIEMDAEAQESWYLLKLSAQYELRQFREAAETLQLLIRNWPDRKTYWTQLANMHSQLDEEAKALAVMALAHRKGLLDQQADLLYLASLFALEEIPYKAAEVLQQGLESGAIESTSRHWSLAADNWYAAAELERALAAYAQAGNLASDGDSDLRRAYILVDQERWEEAQEALLAAIGKAGISENRMGEAYLLLGMAEFSLGQWDQASANWGRAARYPNSRAAAEQWMNHLREERARKSS